MLTVIAMYFRIYVNTIKQSIVSQHQCQLQLSFEHSALRAMYGKLTVICEIDKVLYGTIIKMMKNSKWHDFSFKH